MVDQEHEIIEVVRGDRSCTIACSCGERRTSVKEEGARGLHAIHVNIERSRAAIEAGQAAQPPLDT